MMTTLAALLVITLSLATGETLFILFSDDPNNPTHEEMVQAMDSCHGQRIGDPLFHFPYDMPCDEWVKAKVGDNEYTRQWLADHMGRVELVEKEGGN